MDYKSVIKQNVPYIWEYWLKCIGISASVLSAATLFVTWEDIRIKTLWMKMAFLAVSCIVLLLWAFFWMCVLKKEKVIWKNAAGRIIIRYSDLLQEGFDKKNKTPGLYVIPVNSAFDTIVDTDISLCEKPLVSPNSLHGRWVQKMLDRGSSLLEIDTTIASCLEKQKKTPYKVLSDTEKERGKKEIYELGTVAMVKADNGNIFCLLAMSDYDENNNAYVSIENLEGVIKSLINFYDQQGQGNKLVVPLMGTNLSRAGLTHEDSLRVIASMFQLYGDKVHGDVSIIIYKGDKDKVSLGSYM